MDVFHHGIKTRYAYDFPLCFPHDLIMILRNIKSNVWSEGPFSSTCTLEFSLLFSPLLVPPLSCYHYNTRHYHATTTTPHYHATTTTSPLSCYHYNTPIIMLPLHATPPLPCYYYNTPIIMLPLKYPSLLCYHYNTPLPCYQYNIPITMLPLQYPHYHATTATPPLSCYQYHYNNSHASSKQYSFSLYLYLIIFIEYRLSTNNQVYRISQKAIVIKLTGIGGDIKRPWTTIEL